METQRRFLVLQPGARLHYALPALLAREGMLERLFTDIYAPMSGPLAYLGRRFPAHLPRPVARLLGRRLPPELEGRVSSEPLMALWEAGARSLRRVGLRVPMPDAEARLRDRIIREGFGRATAFYTLSNGDLDLVRAAKAEGLLVVHEQIINPHVGRTLREERDRFPGVEPQESLDSIELGIVRDVEQWKLSDVILAGSEFVRSEILQHAIPSARCAVVPYGVEEDWLALETDPIHGRVLFVGSVGLRKGSHYLAAASRELAHRGVAHEVRVAGPFDPTVVESPPFRGPRYIGQVPRALVKEEFRRADVFVLPTLAEGCALVHLEALACGIPVITTSHCGSVVRDGVDGFVVPVRDPVAIADALERLLRDRQLRDRMAASARERARDYTWARYGERLLKALGLASTEVRLER